MQKVLILIPYYYPGYRSGGPQQTIMNVVEAFGTKNDLHIMTQNRDFGGKEDYPNIKTNIWQMVGKANVMYLKKEDYNFHSLKVAYSQFDKIYSCGLFEKNSIIILLIHRFVNDKKKKVYIAPMGVLSENALKSKSLKKTAFLTLFNKCGFFKNIIWSFTSVFEKKDAEKVLGTKCLKKCIVAEDLPRRIDFEASIERADIYSKSTEKLSVIFLSRICSHKNLIQCIQVLSRPYVGEIIFDIYGVKEELEYWLTCERELNRLPNNVHWNYCGEVKPENVISIFQQYDIFLFPTKSENFGHVIYEALAAGCIPVLSDTTSWQELESCEFASVVPLYNIEEFSEKIEQWKSIPQEQFRIYRKKAIEFAQKKYLQSVKNTGYNEIFWGE